MDFAKFVILILKNLAGEELEEDLINTIPVESDNVASVYTSSVETQ